MVNPERLRKFLPGEVLLVGEVAEDMGIRAYIVGGTVRDIILGRENIDIDMVVEGDYLELSERLKGYGFEARSKTPLRTLKLKRGSLIMDLAGTRKEFYPKPGALPRVEPGNLMEDLARRDFTINSIACSINPSNFGELFDPFDGIGDIGRRVIRVLHEKSFIDDPTRIMRGARYEVRLGFKMDPRTEELARRDGRYIREVGGERIRKELELIFSEEKPRDIIERLSELSLLKNLDPSLGDFPEGIKREYLLFAFLYRASRDFINSLKFPKRKKRFILGLKELSESEHVRDMGRWERVLFFERFEPEVLELASLLFPKLKEVIREYLDELRDIKPILKGDEIRNMGFGGERVGEVLMAIRREKIEGRLKTKEEEMEFVRSYKGAL